MILQRMGGMALILGAAALSYIFYDSYWFSPEATIFGKVVNIAIVVIVLVCGVFFLVKKE